VADAESAQQPASGDLDEYPLKPHELLKVPSYRAFKELVRIRE
jgi:hypothetical protein